MKKKTVFLDRDGTINIEKNYLYKPEEFEFIKNAPEAIKLLKDHGYQVIVVTNQAGVARGYYTEEDVKHLHTYINEQLRKWDTSIDAFYYCPHHPTAGIGKYRVECNCRKPKTGMFEQACRDFEVDKEHSWMIGDNKGDIEAGKNFGLKTILVRTGYGEKVETEGIKEAIVVEDIYTAIQMIVKQNLEGGLMDGKSKY